MGRGHVVLPYLEGGYAALEERGICDTPETGRFMKDWSCPGPLPSTLRTNGQIEAAQIALQVLLHQKHAANALLTTPPRLWLEGQNELGLDSNLHAPPWLSAWA